MLSKFEFEHSSEYSEQQLQDTHTQNSLDHTFLSLVAKAPFKI